MTGAIYAFYCAMCGKHVAQGQPFMKRRGEYVCQACGMEGRE